MVDTQIRSTFVAATAEMDHAHAVKAIENLVGHEISAGAARLLIQGRNTRGMLGGVSFSGRLRTGSLLLPSVPVDVVVSPWSAVRTEIGIGPLGHYGRPGSLRLPSFFRAAWPLVEALIEEITGTPAEATLDLPVAA